MTLWRGGHWEEMHVKMYRIFKEITGLIFVITLPVLPTRWVGSWERGENQGGGHESLQLKLHLAFQSWAGEEVAGLLAPGYTSNHKRSTGFRSRQICVPATHPVMDVSTSCISGTVSVRVLSCRDSERSMLPLRRERGGDTGQHSPPTEGVSPPCNRSPFCTFLPSTLFFVPVWHPSALWSQLYSPHKDMSGEWRRETGRKAGNQGM